MISVIIPSFGNLTRVTNLLKTIQKNESPETYEIIIVNDNPARAGVFDHLIGSFKHVKHVSVIDNPKNGGFAYSINQGLKYTTGDISLLLNDDILLIAPVFKQISEYFHTMPDLGVLGAMLYYPNMAVQHAGMVFNERSKAFLHVKDKQAKSRYCVAVTGAFFAISKERKKLGGFDEQYFLACEDTKYCIDTWNAGLKVYFAKNIEAIHIEGATRGAKIPDKRKFPKWTQAEAKGIIKFKNQLDINAVKQIEKKIANLNQPGPIKVEVGSGFNPQPGFLHLDVRAGLPKLDYVCDFVKQRLPFENGQAIELLANHVIEHIPYRKLPFVISEWARVLKDGGKLTLRTPNLEFICETYLAGLTTPEWPGDEKFIKDNLSPEVTPAWWANIKLFSGQDYDANFHHVCFDFNMLASLLKRYGFGKVKQAKFDKEYSPGELQVEAWKGNKELSCCVIRHGAIGDVLLTAPIIDRLSEDYKHIDVVTRCGAVLELNPKIRNIIRPEPGEPNLSVYDKVIDLNLAYEKNPKMHIIDAYSLVTFGDCETKHNVQLHQPYAIKEDYICIHMTQSWENRTWPLKSWEVLVKKLLEAGERIVAIGSRDDFELPALTENKVNKQKFWEMVETVAKAKMFIGMDSAPLHIAQAVGTHAVGIFTCAKTQFRATGSILSIVPDIDCYGCLHECKPPVTYCGCKRGDLKCLDLITPEIVYERVKLYDRN